MRTVARKSALLSVCLLIGLLGSSRAGATTVNGCAASAGGPTPTNFVFPVDCTGASAGTLLADMVSTFSYTTTSGTNSGTVESAVYDDGGTLDFYYQITNNATSATAIARLTATNFSGSLTDAAFRADGATLTGTSFVDGTNAPVTADSNLTGSVIGFSFYAPTSNEIASGSSSSVLIISTNATHFIAGNVTVIDGGTDTLGAFEPVVRATATPEPSTVLLLGTALSGLLAIRRKIL